MRRNEGGACQVGMRFVFYLVSVVLCCVIACGRLRHKVDNARKRGSLRIEEQ